MDTAQIIIKSARENNLKNVSVNLPRNQIICFVGLSGSGKSSLAYNVLYSEGQRQFLESINTFAARLLKRTQRPDVDDIQNLSPTVSIDQSRLKGNPRSTVGTTTEIYTYLRLLFSRFGSEKDLSAGHFSFNNPKGACHVCKGLGTQFIIDPTHIVDFSKSLAEGAVNHNNYKPGRRLYNIIESSKLLDVNKKIKDYTKEELDFLLYTERVELSNQDQGFIQRFSHEGIITRLIKRAGDLRGFSDRKEKTDKPYVTQQPCSACNGYRLSKTALSSTISDKNIGYYISLSFEKLIDEITQIDTPPAQELVNRIVETTQHLIDVKLGYLNLNRSLDTLSGGEAQRIKLARELGNNLIEIVYILDEPTSGLHSYDRENIIQIIKELKNKGNTVIVIEHDEEIMKNADYIVELGPKAGKQGGQLVFSGQYKDFIKIENSLTASYLRSSLEKIATKSNSQNPNAVQQPTPRRTPTEYFEIKNANTHNLKNIDCKIPMGVLCTFTGVSGSGKSSLLINEFATKYNRTNKNLIIIDQKQFSGMARGNIATYTGIFDKIRTFFADTNNVSKSLFSFNSDGSCPECRGLGYKKIDMHFMGDVTVRCETCQGKRYKKEVLEYKYKDKNIYEILELTIDEAIKFFKGTQITKSLMTLQKVGLGYLELGQSHDTFSGGESQRLKLAKQLDKKGEIYILDEPTAGLHFADIDNLLKLLNEIVDNGNTILAIEHNMQFIKASDWIIDIGPYGGDSGGEIVAEGTPEDVAKNENSLTGKFLKASLQ